MLLRMLHFQMPTQSMEINTASVVSTNEFPLESTLLPFPPFPPDCPTPDYDTSSEPSVKNMKAVTHQNPAKMTRNGSADFVEMQSLESFKLTNPAVSKPKPPSIYFQPNLGGSTSSNGRWDAL